MPSVAQSSKLKAQCNMESLDYDIDASSIFEQDRQRQSSKERRMHVSAKWIVCMVSGLLTGALAFVLDTTAEVIANGKNKLASHVARAASSASAGPAAVLATTAAVYVACCAALVVVACSLVLYGEPIAGGSGIPEVKTYLQGCRVPRMLRVTTLVCKTCGVLCSVSAGLICGKEGPMIHAGAIIAGGLSQGSSKTLKLRTMLLKRFRNDHDKRDFVAAGAAAGVAAAFGAPIGGVLFAMEEAATHWSQQLCWRAFFCALCSTFSLNLLLSSVRGSAGIVLGQLSHPGLLTFGSFLECQTHDLYTLRDLLAFCVIAVISGLCGACFNAANHRLTLWRNRHLTTKRLRLAEALVVVTLTAAACFSLPFLLPCSTSVEPPSPGPPSSSPPPLPPLPPTSPSTNGSHTGECVGVTKPNPLQRHMHLLVCREAGQDSALVRLLFADNNEAIKTLFHEDVTVANRPRDAIERLFHKTARSSQRITPLVCLIFFLYSLGFGLITYGLALPSGLFVPCIMAGAALGRLVGETFGLAGYHTSPGSYALIGAAGMLGGVCRMTISITVIVIESTGNVTFMLPIAISIMLAKLVGDFFTEGIYDIHIGIKRYPFLPPIPPPARSSLQASDVMASSVRTVCEVEQVGTLLKMLRSTTHHGFPVTKNGGGGGVLGVILRDQLMAILAKRQFDTRRAASPTSSPHLGLASHAGPSSQAPPLTSDDFLRPWTALTVEELSATLSLEDLSRVVNLRPYVNEAALVTLRTTSLRRVSRLFLSMGESAWVWVVRAWSVVSGGWYVGVEGGEWAEWWIVPCPHAYPCQGASNATSPLSPPSPFATLTICHPHPSRLRSPLSIPLHLAPRPIQHSLPLGH